VQVIWPGEPNALYHSEDAQECPVSEVSAKYGASAAAETESPDEA
jgi:hypothetical protein